MVKSNDVSNILQVYIIWLSDTKEKMSFLLARYIMAQQLAGKREWEEKR